jgi:putative spermidine/putrescine transport system ATP-binding protein
MSFTLNPRSAPKSDAQASGEIRLVNVTKRFDDTHAVKDINLTIPHGSYCCLLGPSGCGKTIILRMIAGHETPTSGQIYIGDQMVVGKAPVERGAAMMFQNYALFPHLTILDNVAFYLKMRGVGKDERRKRAHQMLERVQLDHLRNRMPAQLSGGQQQRVALARALITNPGFFPRRAAFGAGRISPSADARRIEDSPAELGIAFVHVTHTQPEAIALADTVVVMDHGRIDRAGTANEIFNRPTTPYVARFMGGQNVLAGTVESASGAMARLRGPRGELFEAPLSPAPTIGTPVSIAIRRDRIHVGRVPGEKAELQPNSVAGVVESTEFQGNFVKVNILVEGGGPFVANVSDEEYFGELVKPGDRVVPHWNPEHVHVLSKADSNNAQKPYSEE